MEDLNSTELVIITIVIIIHFIIIIIIFITFIMLIVIYEQVPQLVESAKRKIKVPSSTAVRLSSAREGQFW